MSITLRTYVVTAGAVVSGLLLTSLPSAAAEPAPVRNERVSVSAAGLQGDGYAEDGRISEDGRYVAFSSTSANLLPAALEYPGRQLYVKDRSTSRVELASVAADGTPGNGPVFDTSLSPGGRYAAFATASTNMGQDAPSGLSIYVRDLAKGVTELVSTGVEGYGGQTGGISVSADGRFVAFVADVQPTTPYRPTEHRRVYVRDRVKKTTTQVNHQLPQGTWATSPELSDDGRYVAYRTDRNGTDPGTPGKSSLFRRDLWTGALQQVDVTPAGLPSTASALPVRDSLSADGRYLAFTSEGSDLVAGDTDSTEDVFVRDLRTGRTRLVDISPQGGATGIPVFSPDGRKLAFAAPASRNWLLDVATGRARLLDTGHQGGPDVVPPRLTSLDLHGRRLVMDSSSPDLVPDDSNRENDVFVHETD
ncbi:hypothetical protein [Streptomyces sp. NPDC048442]|uniref:TolB family protein n=1 Tax=Streptomyces sp. NPDC048442 TaxID=3154823 RepID=UPI00342FB50A